MLFSVARQLSIVEILAGFGQQFSVGLLLCRNHGAAMSGGRRQGGAKACTR